MPRRVTQADVARAAHVSPTTVSLVLNQRSNTRIAPQTAARIRDVAARLGYSPDPTALSLRTGQTRTIGFISENVTLTRYASAMISGVLGKAAEQGFSVLIAEVGEDLGSMDAALESLMDRRVDGVVLGVLRARQLDVPQFPMTLPCCVVNGAVTGMPAVLPSEYQAGMAAAAHILDQGHRRIGLLGRSASFADPAVSLTIAQRFAGLDAALAAAHLTFAAEAHGSEWEPELGYTGVDELLTQDPQITAIITANDRVAFGAYQRLTERGLVIPQQMSVISFDDEQLASYLRPGLSTLRLPYQRMGEIGVRRLLEGKFPQRPEPLAEPAETYLVPMPLIRRGSVGPPRESPCFPELC